MILKWPLSCPQPLEVSDSGVPGSPTPQQLKHPQKLMLFQQHSLTDMKRGHQKTCSLSFFYLMWLAAPFWSFQWEAKKTPFTTGRSSNQGVLGRRHDLAQIPALGTQESWRPCATFTYSLKGQCNDGNYGHAQDDCKSLLWNLQFSVALIGLELRP